MKNLILVTLLFFGALNFAQAQQTPKTVNQDYTPTEEDYERMLRAEANLEFRAYAINTLGLDEEQIKNFDPLYREYMRAKNKLSNKKFRLLNEYTEEMAEDDRKQDELNETADFIENYWEVQIAEMELAKDYFDRMEDKIGVDNAFGFFLLEDMAESQAKTKVVEKVYVPIYIEVEKEKDGNSSVMPDKKDIMKQPIDKKYRKDIEAYSSWVESGKGKMTLDHDYTKNGIHALANALVALGEAANVKEGFGHEAQTMKAKADKLQIDETSTKHADWTRESFIMAADMLETIQAQGDFSGSARAVGHAVAAAKKINPDQLLTNQAAHVHDFFRKANMAIDSMANSMSWAAK